MSTNLRNSLEKSIRALSNVIRDIFRKIPYLFFVVAWSIYRIVNEYFNTVGHKQFILCLLIFVVSVGIYAKNKNISETMLTFMIGVLTVFTIDWEEADFRLFMLFYLVFNLMIFVIGSINLAVKKDNILIQAANSLCNDSNYDEIHRKLNKIFDKSTPNNQLAPIERAEAIRFLAFRRVDIDDMLKALSSIEIIKTVWEIDLNKACNVFYILYVFSYNHFPHKNPSKNTIELFNKILTISLPPEQFFELFLKTKKKIISDEMDFDTYIKKIKELAINGMDSCEIIEELRKPHEE
ncbi:hypothetical protein CPJCM30710_27070 [Clostridium polyendosporum]|uniref:Uncharacterized protein n=1 Tax=Clostridium polyendosporum TaxID=69208 RepID=A0A919S2A7_9CLOT|nr:hypothetical protein [Clostridium polyendosporum]GIM30041.1 hypothetical protein CPJCM30710_27070 [Clostridium polyendosporum]